MQSATPLIRHTVNAAKVSSTCIPHIRCHILERRRRVAKLGESLQRQIRRSTVLINHQGFTEWPITNEAEDHDKRHQKFAPTSVVESVASQEFATDGPRWGEYMMEEINIAQLLAENNPHRLFSWLTTWAYATSRDAFIHSADDATFEAAFCALDPKRLLEIHRVVEKHVHPNGSILHHFEPELLPRLDHFTRSIDGILDQRQSAGHTLTLRTIEHALKWAASIGDVRIAQKMWLMLSDHNLTPSLACYNEYMASHVNHLAFSAPAALSFRVTEHHTHLRSISRRPEPFRGYAVDMFDPLSTRSLKGQCLAIFRELSERQLPPNEDTFVSLMIAMARAGDMAAVASILKSVWNVDVDQLNAFDEEEIESPTFYEKDHPLRPSAKLLHAVVHAYCINSDTAQAWKLLDYISRNYDLQIPDACWEQLFEWTFVLGVPRSSSKGDRGDRQGQLRLDDLDTLTNMMQDEPYNVQLSPMMLHLRSRNLRYQKKPLRVMKNLREAFQLFHTSCDRLRLKVARIEEIAKDVDRYMENGMLSQAFVQAKIDLELEFESLGQQHRLLSRETQATISESQFLLRNGGTGWTRRGIPHAIHELYEWSGGIIRYSTTTGKVQLQEWTADHEFDIYAHFPQAYIEGMAVYRILATPNLETNRVRLQELPEVLSQLRDDELSKQSKFEMITEYTTRTYGVRRHWLD